MFWGFIESLRRESGDSVHCWALTRARIAACCCLRCLALELYCKSVTPRLVKGRTLQQRQGVLDAFHHSCCSRERHEQNLVYNELTACLLAASRSALTLNPHQYKRAVPDDRRPFSYNHLLFNPTLVRLPPEGLGGPGSENRSVEVL